MPIYNFCPKCGSVTKEGVCDNCGFVAPDHEPPVSKEPTASQNPFADAISANSGVFPSSSSDDSMFAPKENVETPVQEEKVTDNIAGIFDSVTPAVTQAEQVITPPVQPQVTPPVQPQVTPLVQSQVQPQVNQQVQPQV